MAANSSPTNPDGAQLDCLIQGIAGGDRDAFRRLYEALRTPVYRFALSQLHDLHRAEDVMQDTFFSILRYAGSYRSGTNPRAWIFTIARNHVISAQKAVSADALPLESDLLWSSDGQEALLDSISALEALAILSREEREILSLYLYGGMRRTEIARMLKIPYLKVRSKYGYAIQKLKTYYTKSERIQP